MNRLVWFRNDLRVSDNETLIEAIKDHPVSLAFLFVYDESWDELTPEHVPRMGHFKKRYLAESVKELSENLRAIGAELICLTGDPTKIVVELCQSMNIQQLYLAEAQSFDERRADEEIENQLRLSGVATYRFETTTLIHPSDLAPFDFTQPSSFSKFKKAVEKKWPVRVPNQPPTDIQSATSAPETDFERWNFEDRLVETPTPSGVSVRGGQLAAGALVDNFVWVEKGLRSYRETRNGLLKFSDSSKFSPALAAGCLSARGIYENIRRFESLNGSNSSTLWFIYELLWRDHFQYAARRKGRSLFTDNAQATPQKSRAEQESAFTLWSQGQTQSDFINAAMIELQSTGWMSNRMRQNTASYLVHDLGVDWKKGARWFESFLVDYDACSNWGNWAYIAGAGPDNQPHLFDVDQQREAYDPHYAYQKYWLG